MRKIGGKIRRGVLNAGSRMAEAALAMAGVQRPEVVLVLGHMRCGSTLLTHLLLEHPLFSGLGERNATYFTRGDLARLAIESRLRRHAGSKRIRFVVDQINHSRFTPESAPLDDRRTRLLFMARGPAATISSLLELTRKYYEAWSVRQCVDYYVERLGALAHLATLHGPRGRSGFITYEDLTARSAQALAGLQTMLGTEPAFSEDYRTHEFTGTSGDPGPRIRSGRITSARTPAHTDLPREELERAALAHTRCLETMAPYALIEGSPTC